MEKPLPAWAKYGLPAAGVLGGLGVAKKYGPQIMSKLKSKQSTRKKRKTSKKRRKSRRRR